MNDEIATSNSKGACFLRCNIYFNSQSQNLKTITIKNLRNPKWKSISVHFASMN